MKFFILFAVIFGAAFCQNQVNPDGCGISPKLDNYVVGGVEAQNGAHPWIVSMEYGNGVTFSHSCGGQLLNEKWVLTAAHCVAGRPNTANYRIQIGAHNRNSPNSWQIASPINRIISHPSYNSANFKNDLALLRLTNPISLNGDTIVAGCLYCSTDSVDNLADGRKVVVAGWGSTFSGGSVVPTLRHAKVPITSNSSCTSFYGTSYDPITMICFAEVGDGLDTCQGDSGGPNVVRNSDGKWYNAGITSWGRGCGNIGVYTRVNQYCDWIQAQMTANP